MRAAILAILLLTLAAAPVCAKSAPNVFDHKDWIGVCDNTLRCTVMGMTPDGGDSRAYIALSRDGGGSAAPTLKLVVYSDVNIPAGLIALRAPGFELSAPATSEDNEITAETKDPAAIAAFAKLAASDAKSVELSMGKIKLAIPLSGAAAALIWVDDRQGRIGTVTALTRRGPRPASDVPPAPSEPVYTAAAKGSASEINPAVFPKALLARPELKDCDKDQLLQAQERAAWRLGPDVILWSVPCTLGAYNLDSVFFLSDARGGAVRPAPIPSVPTPDSLEPGADPPFSRLNADFDPKTMVLNAFEKGRGLGDCGALLNFLWDGKTFEPLEIDYMPECRGVEADAWPALHRARAR